MRKITPFLLISCICFFGCGDDDNSASFVGTWVADNITVSDCSEPARNRSDALDCDDVSCFKLVLNGDKTYTFQRGLPVESGNWDAGDFLNLCMDSEGEIICERFAAQFSGISMILTADSTSSGCVTSYIFNLQAPDTSQ
ncbi:MAG: hypothetical protein ABJG47_18950 [Ekhidna sp.]